MFIIVVKHPLHCSTLYQRATAKFKASCSHQDQISRKIKPFFLELSFCIHIYLCHIFFSCVLRWNVFIYSMQYHNQELTESWQLNSPYSKTRKCTWIPANTNTEICFQCLWFAINRLYGEPVYLQSNTGKDYCKGSHVCPWPKKNKKTSLEMHRESAIRSTILSIFDILGVKTSS
jgi:Pyruvate/2-oxoacid:ferredoxin oxidoreductase delta subunit